RDHEALPDLARVLALLLIVGHRLLLVLGLSGRDLALAQQRLDTGDVAPNERDARHVVELTRRVLEAEVEELFLRLVQAVCQLRVVELTQLSCSCSHGFLTPRRDAARSGT